MQTVEIRLTVFFDDPFWVGVYERVAGDALTACKVTFGARPKDYQVHDFVLHHWSRLTFSPPVAADARLVAKPNPKRMQRAIQKELTNQGIGTKSQQALKLQQEEGKIIRKAKSRAQKEEEKQRQFDLRQQKRKEKRRGR